MKRIKHFKLNGIKREWKEREEADDINSEEYWDSLAENDEISIAEAAFMHGYLNA